MVMQSPTAQKSLPCQMEVYFPVYPTLDLQRIAAFVDGCEDVPFGKVELQGHEDQANAAGLRIGSFIAAQGSMTMAALVHNFPSRDLPEKTRQELLPHESFALLTLLGGDELAPVERLLFLYKVTTALCLQGATGMSNPYIGHMFPAQLLTKLLGEKHPDIPMTIWDALRRLGDPPHLLMTLGNVEIDGRRYGVTRGFGYCGLPDLIWAYTTVAEAKEVTNVFENCFRYMMERGPVIKAGNTMGYDQNVAFRFLEPPPELKLPYPTDQVLLVVKERR